MANNKCDRYCPTCNKITEHERKYLGGVYKCMAPDHKNDPMRCEECGRLLEDYKNNKGAGCTLCYWRYIRELI